jgi:hypothetical protein
MSNFVPFCLFVYVASQFRHNNFVGINAQKKFETDLYIQSVSDFWFPGIDEYFQEIEHTKVFFSSQMFIKLYSNLYRILSVKLHFV